MLSVGRIARLFGEKGEVVINLYTNFPDNFDTEEQPLFTMVDGLVVPLFFDTFNRKSVASAVACFADIDTPQRAMMIVGNELFVEENSDTEDDEFCMEDLIGFEVRVGKNRGQLTDYYDSEANPLFEIEIGGKSHLIPAVEEFIAHIDFEQHWIKFVLPEGLLEL